MGGQREGDLVKYHAESIRQEEAEAGWRKKVEKARAMAGEPATDQSREATCKLRLRALREGRRLPSGLPQGRPSAEAVAEGLGCLETLRMCGLRVVYKDELEAMKAAREVVVRLRRDVETHGYRGGRAEGPRWFTFPYRILERLEEGEWRPVALVHEDREVWSRRSGGGYLKHIPMWLSSLEEVEIEELHSWRGCRLSPILEAPAGTDPLDLLPKKGEADA